MLVSASLALYAFRSFHLMIPPNSTVSEGSRIANRLWTSFFKIFENLWMMFAFTLPIIKSMGEMRRAIAREQEERWSQDRFSSTLVISASIIAAVRLAREDISTPSPRMMSAVAESVHLARLILKRVVGS